MASKSSASKGLMVRHSSSNCYGYTLLMHEHIIAPSIILQAVYPRSSFWKLTQWAKNIIQLNINQSEFNFFSSFFLWFCWLLRRWRFKILPFSLQLSIRRNRNYKSISNEHFSLISIDNFDLSTESSQVMIW